MDKQQQFEAKQAELQSQHNREIHLFTYSVNGKDVYALVWEPAQVLKAEIFNWEINNQSEVASKVKTIYDKIVHPESDNEVFSNEFIQALVIKEIIASVKLGKAAQLSDEQKAELVAKSEEYTKQYGCMVVSAAWVKPDGNTAVAYIKGLDSGDIFNFMDAQYGGKDYIYINKMLDKLVVGDSDADLLKYDDIRLSVMLFARLNILVQLESYKKK